MRKKQTEKEKLPKPPLLKEETRSTVIAIVFFVLAIFFILASFEKAGGAGNFIFGNLSWLLGYGYFLIPILLIILGTSLMKNVGLQIAARNIIGSTLFVLSGLGILSSLSQKAGGLLGGLITSLLIPVFDIYFTSFLLFALFILSVIVLLDTAPRGEHFALLKEKLFKKKEPPAEVEPVAPMVVPDLPPVQDPVETPVTSVPEEEKSSMVKEFFGFGKKNPEEDFEDKKEEPKHLRFPLKNFVPPPLSLLEEDKGKRSTVDVKANSNIIKHTLQNFGIVVEMDEVAIGPSVTRYALKPAEGVKLSRIESLQNELALALAAHPVRIEAPIPGTSLVGVEVPNSAKTTVGLGTILASPEFTESSKPLLVSLGKSISGTTHFGNIAKMPHLLIAGTTGSGKSVTVLTMITSLLYRNPPENLKLVLVDPKRVTLPLFNGIPHLLTPVITDAKKTLKALNWLTREMDRRYETLEKYRQTDIQKYHEEVLGDYLKKIHEAEETGASEEEISEIPMPERMPYIVVVIDELADLMQAYPRELEGAIVRLAQMSRAVGIHLVLSTQRPSVNVLTGLIKANIPSRVALRVISQIDSRTILDAKGAENLLGGGDMLYQGDGMSKPIRLQSAFISDTEIKKVTKFIVDQYRDVPPEYIAVTDVPGQDSIFTTGTETGSDVDDDLYEDVRAEVIKVGKASTSYIQRKFSIGYGRAAKLIDILEEKGVVGPANGSKPREVLIGNESTVDQENNESDIENTMM